MGTQKNRRDETVLLSLHEKRGRTGNVTTTNAEDGRLLPRGGGGGGGGYSNIFIHTYFLGYEDFVDIFLGGSSQNWTIFRGHFYAF